MSQNNLLKLNRKNQIAFKKKIDVQPNTPISILKKESKKLSFKPDSS